MGDTGGDLTACTWGVVLPEPGCTSFHDFDPAEATRCLNSATALVRADSQAWLRLDDGLAMRAFCLRGGYSRRTVAKVCDLGHADGCEVIGDRI